MMKPMTEDERVVREAWESVSCTNFFAGTRCCVEAWFIWLPCNWTSRIGDTPSDEVMWSAAAEFTRQRQREIAKAQRGHTWLVSNCPNNWDREYLLDLIDKHLAELQKGMKA